MLKGFIETLISSVAAHNPPESLEIPLGVRWNWGMRKGVRLGTAVPQYNSNTRQRRISADSYWGFKEGVAFELVIEDFWGLWWVEEEEVAPQAEGGEMNLESLCSSDQPSLISSLEQTASGFSGTDKAQKKKVNQMFYLKSSPRSGLQLSNAIHFIHHTQFSTEIPIISCSLKKACQNASLIFPETWPQMGLILFKSSNHLKSSVL